MRLDDDRRFRLCRLPWRAASLLTRLALRASPAAPAGAAAIPEAASVVDWAATCRGARLTIVALPPFRQRVDLRARLAHYGLSPRELAVAWYSVRDGLNAIDLAQRLCISVHTVKCHFREVYRKTGVNNQRERVVRIFGRGNDRPPFSDRRYWR